MGDTELYLDTSAHVDTEGEKARLKKEIDEKREYIRILDIKLTNTDFVRNAPEKIVRLEQEKRLMTLDQIAKLEEKFALLEA